MKNIKRSFICLPVVCLLFVSSSETAYAASATKTYNKAATAFKKGNYKLARKNFRRLKRRVNEACVENMPYNTKKAYLKMLLTFNTDSSSGKKYLWGYYLTDIDKDGNAELIVQYGKGEADVKAYVYFCKKGRVRFLGKFDCGHSSFYYDPRGNGMTVHYGHMGYENIRTLKIKKNKLKISSWRKRERFTRTGSYMPIPYELDDHVTWQNGIHIDYSPFFAE